LTLVRDLTAIGCRVTRDDRYNCHDEKHQHYTNKDFRSSGAGALGD